MSASFPELYRQLSDWCQQANEAGWVDNQDLEQLTRIETQEADALFSASGQRPLIVAFFGGTGVGKSSLLNRLAGEAIARTGVERPTSKEVTLYIHRDFQLRSLPEELPEEDAVLAYHDDDSRRMVAWLDLPDFDSTESEHRAQVEKWLPYIDWVIYVVSPERYHDDLGWRFLQQRQAHHSWLFVMNHWDEGRPEQRQDFERRLIADGFVAPVILTTDCGSTSAEDEFSQLELTINNSIREFGLSFLQSLGGQARLRELSELASRLSARIGDEQRWEEAESKWNTLADQQLALFENQLHAASVNASRPLIARERQDQGWLRHKAPSAEALESPAQEIIERLAHDAAGDVSGDLALKMAQQLRSDALPAAPHVAELKTWQSSISDTLTEYLRRGKDDALAQPGSKNQRALHKLFRTLMWLLPLSAAAWAIWFIVRGFYLGTLGHQAFLGLDFAIHSVMMIALGWLIPWIIQLQLRPSPARSLQRGFAAGIGDATEEMKQQLTVVFEKVNQQRREQQKQLAVIRDSINATL